MLINVLGSFVGECIRHEFGGEWKQVDGQWGISFDPLNVAFPFAKITKQFENGHEGGDSIFSLYEIIPLLVNKKPWVDAREANSDTPLD
jgi:hypothetical protein